MDMGATWTQVLAPPTQAASYLSSGLFLSPDIGYAFSYNGYVLKLGPGTPTSVKNEVAAIPKEFQLFQNYPNPFNPTTSIIYDVPRSSKVVLKIYNSLGQEVKTLVNDVQNAGKYTVTFNASNIASGMYFYRIQADGFTSIKKMLLLK
jgi:hypothetical protein